MKNIVILLSLVALMVACQKAEKPHIRQIVNYDELKSVIQKEDEKLYVVNFWATWCAPCVAELPDFMEVNDEFSGAENYQMILVSLDNANDFEPSIKPFLLEKKIGADVYLLNDNKRMNYWISDIDENWSGAIPATVIYKNGKKLFFKEDKMDKETLRKIIKQHL